MHTSCSSWIFSATLSGEPTNNQCSGLQEVPVQFDLRVEIFAGIGEHLSPAERVVEYERRHDAALGIPAGFFH